MYEAPGIKQQLIIGIQGGHGDSCGCAVATTVAAVEVLLLLLTVFGIKETHPVTTSEEGARMTAWNRNPR